MPDLYSRLGYQDSTKEREAKPLPKTRMPGLYLKDCDARPLLKTGMPGLYLRLGCQASTHKCDARPLLKTGMPGLY